MSAYKSTTARGMLREQIANLSRDIETQMELLGEAAKSTRKAKKEIERLERLRDEFRAIVDGTEAGRA